MEPGTGASSDAEGSQPQPERTLTTTINRGWRLKMSIITVFLVGLGVWGLVDALIVYPARGARHAEYMRLQYLVAANAAGELLRAGVDNPREELARLTAERSDIVRDLRQTTEGSTLHHRHALRMARLEWLTSLSRIGRVSPEHTQIASPRQDMEGLANEWATKNAPKPLASYDIPSQWIFVAVGFGGAGWLISLMTRVSRVRFRYEPASLRLTLPDGRSITPEQIAEVDKRKWHKFFVTLRLKEGGPDVQLDLLRYKPLEDWVLEMEKQTDGYEEPEAEEDESEEQAQSEPAGASTDEERKGE